MRISNIEGEEQEKHGTGEQKGETMSDLIDRQVAIDAIFSAFCYAYCDNCENNNKDDSSCDECHRKYQNWSASRNTIERVINNLPSAEPETNYSEIPNSWIPCSERMPDEHEWLGTKTFGTTISDEVYVTFENPKGERFCKHLSFQNKKLSDYDQHTIDAFYKGSKPIAWMPLPEPYQPEEE